jgi:hypothetical protein
MKITDKKISPLAQNVLNTYSHSSSLEEKASAYFSKDPSQVDVFKQNIDYFKTLLKEGDELVHAMYITCYGLDSPYLEKYENTSFETIKTFIESEGKTVKTSFHSDNRASGIFDYKVAYVAQLIFSEDSEKTLELAGDNQDE